MQVGDRVVMSDQGRLRYRDMIMNPHFLGGVVAVVRGKAGNPFDEYWGLPIRVDWDNGQSNGYHLSDLRILNETELTEDDLKELI